MYFLLMPSLNSLLITIEIKRGILKHLSNNNSRENQK